MKGTAYLLQAALICLWWVGLLISPKFFAAFQFPGIPPIAFQAFMLPDLAVVALLSIVRAYREKEALTYVILGGFAFATLYCVNATVLTGGGYLATVLMVLGLCYNLFLIYGPLSFRSANTSSLMINGMKTILQILGVWVITLVVFPVLLMSAFGEITMVNGFVRWIGVGLFLVSSLLGLTSAYLMVSKGEGTPLPLDQTQKLVTEGPYKYVRNPMAIAGIGQGVSISLLYWSLPVLAYALLGAILWHLVVRPLEEQNMLERFGTEYQQYRMKVKCWIPRWSA